MHNVTIEKGATKLQSTVYTHVHIRVVLFQGSTMFMNSIFCLES